MIKDPNEAFEAIYDSGTSGLVGTLAVAIHDNQSTVVFGPTTANIIELAVAGQDTARYRAALTAPAIEGEYTIHWSEDGTFDPDSGGAVEDLLIEDTSLNLPSLGGATAGVLCSAWTTAEEVVACCSAELDSSGVILDAAIVGASEWLYLAEGRQHPGVCTSTVRPCATDCGCGYQVLSRGHLVGWDGDCWSGHHCGCTPLSQVKLPGHVRSITSVKIDGVALDPSEYFVYENTFLTRKNGERWPSCQALDLDDTEEGTFSVTYTFGKAPPVLGQLAARDLACEIAKACDPGSECAIPNGVIRVTRNGISFERSPLARNADGRWETGMMSVDLYLNAVNPHGLTRTGTVWSASRRSRYARPAPS